MISWKEKSETLILCEGYQDRAFWAGCLVSAFRAQDARDIVTSVESARSDTPNLPARKKRLYDPWDKPVEGGAYAFISPAGKYIRLNPCNGCAGILPALRSRLKLAEQRPLRSVIVSVDEDTLDGVVGHPPITMQGISESLAKGFPGFGGPPEDGLPILPSTNANIGPIALVHLRSAEGGKNGLPAKACLEQLVCSAVAKVYPDRLPTVTTWLASRKDPPAEAQQEKEIALSLVAGWHAHQGVEGFYRAIWADRPIREALIAELQHSGQWKVVQSALDDA